MRNSFPARSVWSVRWPPLVVLVACSAAYILGAAFGVPAARAAAPSTSIAGAWAFESETNTETGEVTHSDKDMEAIWVFTSRYHCLARMERNRHGVRKAELDALPPDKQVQYYEQLLKYASTAGTYTTSGNRLTRLWQISLGPELVGEQSVATYSADRTRLVVDLPRRDSSSGPATRVVYRRLE
jgi:hypothetical protein